MEHNGIASSEETAPAAVTPTGAREADAPPPTAAPPATRAALIAPSEIDLAEALLVVWRRKGLIATGTAVAAACALAVSLVLPKQYLTSTTMMVVRSKFGSEQQPLPQQAMQMTKTYRGIIMNTGALTAAIDALALDEPPHELEPRDLEQQVEVAVVKDTSLLSVSVELPDAELAAAAANFLAERAIALNSDLNAGDVRDSRAFLEAQVSQAKDVLAAAESALETFKREADLEIVNERVKVHLGRLRDLETERARVEVELAGLRGNIAGIERELEGQPRTVTTSRSLVRDSAYQQAVAKMSGAEMDALLGITMQNEQLNPTHQSLVGVLTDTRSREQGLVAKRRTLDAMLAANATALATLQDELTTKTMTTEQLKRSVQIAREAHSSLRGRLQKANFELVSKTSLLTIVDRALPPTRHERPRAALNTAVGAVAGLLAMVLLAFFVDFLRRAQGGRAPAGG